MNLTRPFPPPTILSSATPKPWRGRTLLFALILSFGVMSSLAPILHNHEWTNEQTEENCSPCQWAHSGIGLETKIPDLQFTAPIRAHALKLNFFPSKSFSLSIQGEALLYFHSLNPAINHSKS